MATLESEGYQLLTTDEMLSLLESGHTLTLPPSFIEDASVRANYPPEELECLALEGSLNEIAAIEYIGEQEVQCIAVDDPEHMYLTDYFIPTHNTSNIVFLKSTDDSMLDTLQKMSGTQHRAYKDSKTVTRDLEAMLMQNEGRMSVTVTVREEPVISYNDMAFIPQCNSIVFRAGDSPIWNRDMTILPMSWRLFKNTIVQPGKNYSLQTIPTTSTAAGFDVRKNMPNFDKMLNKRMAQAMAAEDAKKRYQEAYEFSDYEISTLDPDVYANEVMDIINEAIHPSAPKSSEISDELMQELNEEIYNMGYDDELYDYAAEAEENTEVIEEVRNLEAIERVRSTPRFAGNTLSQSDLVNAQGQVTHRFDVQIEDAYKRCKGALWHDTQYFKLVEGADLYSADGTKCYVSRVTNSSDLQYLQEESENPESRVFSDSQLAEVKELGTYKIHDDFYRFLAEKQTWSDIADGKFERAMANAMADV